MTNSQNSIDNSSLISALGRISSGIYILTIGSGDKSTGMLASWVQQAGFEPPMLTVAVKRGRYVAEWLASKQPFNLNVVGEGQTHFVKHFGKGFDPGVAAFEGIETTEADNGVPVLAEAIATLECTVEDSVETPDHIVFLAKIVAGSVHDQLPPMVHLRKRGDQY